jgi:hypothetical protein
MKSYIYWSRRVGRAASANSDAAIAFLPYEKSRHMLFAQAGIWVPFRGRVGRPGLRRPERPHISGSRKADDT